MKLQLPRRRVWRVGIYLFSLVLMLLAADGVFVQAERVIPPAYDTTRIVSPVRDDGTIDYLTAVDNQFGAGATPENNAAIPMLQALGRQAIPRYQPPDGLTDRLGMKPLPKDGDYFIPYDDYCKQHNVAPTQWTDLTHPRPWPVTFDEITQQWVKANEKSLLLVTEASTRTRFSIPFYAGYRPETMIEIQLPYVKGVREACRALETRALIRLTADDIAGFRSDLLAIHRLARLLAQQPTMIERIVAASIETSACEAERVGVSSGKLSADQLRSMASDLAALPDMLMLADCLDCGERYFALDTLQVLAHRNPYRAGQLFNAITDARLGPPWLFLFLPIQYAQTMRSINHYEDGALAALRQPTYPRRIAALELSEKLIDTKESKDLSIRDLLGPDWPVQLFAPALRRAVGKETTAMMENRLTQLAVLLATYKADHGSYPATLADLSPTYIKSIPNDLFTEKPLIYTRTEKGYALYSAGPNMTDDGGKSADPADDLVASVP